MDVRDPLCLTGGDGKEAQQIVHAINELRE